MTSSALSAHEWKEYIERPNRIANGVEESAQTGDFHAAAALCLYGQPFGFTREDVTVILRSFNASSPDAFRLRSIADRIEALLPPEASA